MQALTRVRLTPFSLSAADEVLITSGLLMEDANKTQEGRDLVHRLFNMSPLDSLDSENEHFVKRATVLLDELCDLLDRSYTDDPTTNSLVCHFSFFNRICSCTRSTPLSNIDFFFFFRLLIAILYCPLIFVVLVPVVLKTLSPTCWRIIFRCEMTDNNSKQQLFVHVQSWTRVRESPQQQLPTVPVHCGMWLRRVAIYQYPLLCV